MKSIQVILIVLAVVLTQMPLWSETSSPDKAPLPDFTENPITLDQALQIAFQHSPDIKIALNRIEKSKGVLSESKARFLPTFNAGASTTVQGPTVSIDLFGEPMDIVPSNATSATAGFLLPLDISNQISYGVDLADSQFKIEYFMMLAASEDLIYKVKSAYYGMLRAKSGMDVAQAAVDVAQIRLKNAESMESAGAAPKFDVTAAKVDLANLNQQLLSAKNGVRIAQAALNAAMGIDVNNPTKIVETAQEKTIREADIPKSIDEAFARRPEIKASEEAVNIGMTFTKLQKAGLKPSLALQGGLNYSLNTTALNPNDLSWQATLALSIPIFDATVKGRVQAAKADTQNYKDTLEQTKLLISQQVRTAALSLQDAASRTETSAENVSLAEEALRLTNIRYQAGIAVPVEVTNAEAQLTQARFNHVNAQYDYALALAQLERAVSSQPELEKLQLLNK